jgi:hypothetical protein
LAAKTVPRRRTRRIAKKTATPDQPPHCQWLQAHGVLDAFDDLMRLGVPFLKS